MKKILLIIAFLALASCQPEKSELPVVEQMEGCGVLNDTTPGLDNQQQMRMRNLRIANFPVVKVQATIGLRYYNKVGVTKTEGLLEAIERKYEQHGINIKFVNTRYISPDVANPFVGATTALPAMSRFVAAFPVAADLGMYIDEGNGAGLAEKVGAIGTDDNHCVVMIPTTFNSNIDLFSTALNATTHELGHLLGSNHSFACAWTVDGIPNQVLDNSGALTGYGSVCAGKRPAPASEFYTMMSYGHLIAGASKSLMVFHEQCVLVMKAHILANAHKLGCWNNSGNITFSNGSVTWDNSDTDETIAKLYAYAAGNSTLKETKTISKQPSEIRLYASDTTHYKSGTKGWTFKFNTDIRGFENVVYTATKPVVDMRSSTSYNGVASAGNTSVSTNPFPISGYKMFKPANTINLRPSNQVSGQKIEAYLTKPGGSGNFVYTPSIAEGKYYFVDISTKCGGIARRVWLYKQVADWSGKEVKDSGGTGNYENGQDITYTYPARTRIAITEYSMADLYDYLQYSTDSGATWKRVSGVGVIESGSNPIIMNFRSDRSSTRAGFSFTPTKL